MTTHTSPPPPPVSDDPDQEQTRARGGPCTCGAWIRWVQTIAGALMPIDPDPHPDGTVVPVLVDGKRLARVLPAAELELHNGARFRAHWVTCPHVVRHRRPRRYDQCDDTCTVDCGHCKGQGPPTDVDALAAVRDVFDVEELP